MNIPNVPLIAARNTDMREPFGLLGEDDGPLDLSAATLKMQVRLYGAQPGAALVSLVEVTDDSEGIRVVDAAGGIIRISIDQDTLADMPGGPTAGSEPNQPDTFVYDLVITWAAPIEPVAMAGTFTLYPGVTL